jgi:hypothetical protein
MGQLKDLDEQLRLVGLWRALRGRDAVGAAALVSDVEPVAVDLMMRVLAALDRQWTADAGDGVIDDVLELAQRRIVADLAAAEG